MASAGKSSSDLDRGRRIGKYEIITRLSVGGMAELFLAFLPGPGGFKKYVALKQILPDVRADDSFVKMFLDEARITAAFNNANIGQVYDLGEESDELYLAMEFIAGQNLEQTIKRAAKREAPVPVAFAARVIRDVCLGLHYAHHFTDPTGQPMGVVHRDVSPKNVMITWQGQVKVIDFGIAKARGRLGRTMIGIVKGTSGYMSPEQVKNLPLDGRTDLFAAGVMLHEMLVGDRLFTAPTDAMMMLKIVDGEVSSPSIVNPYVSPALEAVVLKALTKNRDQRFATGKEMARAIEQACPELFDDEQMAEYMAQLFEDKIALTRSLLEQAADQPADQQQVKRAVVSLTNDERDSDPNLERAKNARAQATPAPRAPPRAQRATGAQPAKVPPKNQRTGRSSQRIERVPEPVDDVTLRPGTPSPFEATNDAATDERTPVPSTKARSARPSAVVKRVEPATDPSQQVTPPPKSSGNLGLIVAIVGLLAVIGGLGWAVTVGPFKGTVPIEDERVEVDEGPKKIELGAEQPSSEKPQWLIEREKQKAEEEAERKRQAELEAEMNNPERLRLLAELEAEIKQLDYLEAEQRSLKLATQQGTAAGAANSKRIDDLQKQIDDLKAMVADKRRRSGNGSTAVQVVNDRNSAKRNAVGYFSLRTINPSSAAVLLAGETLGSTPLKKVPLEAGVHKLVVVDGDGKSRLLSVIIASGKTVEMPAVDVSSLPFAP